MPRSSSAALKRTESELRPFDMPASTHSAVKLPVHPSIHCALVLRPDPVEKQKRQILRSIIVAIAGAAVFLLIAIAAYYIHGKA